MILGFTGSRNGMTAEQCEAFGKLISELQPTEFRHGACIGSDEWAAGAVRMYFGASVRIVAHPGRSVRGGKNLQYAPKSAALSDEVLTVRPFMDRNFAIVAACDRLVACPNTFARLSSGGTWATIGFAEQANRPLSVIWPDGVVTDSATMGKR